MLTRDEKNIYFYNTFKLSLVFVLFTLTLFFYLFQKFESTSVVKSAPIQVEIYVEEIPVTRQKHSARPLKPKRPSMGQIVAVEEDTYPEEMVLDESPGKGRGISKPGGVPVEVAAKPLIEYYPDVTGIRCKGVVRLLLLINKSGHVESVENLENTTHSETCLQRAKQAALKTRWIPALVDSKPVKSWVTKEYKFNMAK
ncbi:MAG TPA: hypothetical protein ENK14_03730 [Caldithrix sp.]|nr:hypothetical protein [Caldithrix sp.]